MQEINSTTTKTDPIEIETEANFMVEKTTQRLR